MFLIIIFQLKTLCQVINPLPSLDDSCDRPIAKALFDFEDEQEQDLLSFKQVNSCIFIFLELHKFYYFINYSKRVSVNTRLIHVFSKSL